MPHCNRYSSAAPNRVCDAPLPTDLTPLEEMQFAQIWHTIVALAMIVIIIAHIYIGSLGMEGAFDAMGSGMVDRHWAEEHHDIEVQDEAGKVLAKKRLPEGLAGISRLAYDPIAGRLDSQT